MKKDDTNIIIFSSEVKDEKYLSFNELYEKISKGEMIPKIKEVNDKPIDGMNVFYQESDISDLRNKENVINLNMTQYRNHGKPMKILKN